MAVPVAPWGPGRHGPPAARAGLGAESEGGQVTSLTQRPRAWLRQLDSPAENTEPTSLHPSLPTRAKSLLKMLRILGNERFAFESNFET